MPFPAATVLTQYFARFAALSVDRQSGDALSLPWHVGHAWQVASDMRCCASPNANKQPAIVGGRKFYPKVTKCGLNLAILRS